MTDFFQLVIATLGLSIALKQTVKGVATAQVLTFPSVFSDTLLTVAGVRVSAGDIGTVVVGLQAFLGRTLTGRAKALNGKKFFGSFFQKRAP